jgi:hypothetical protein
MMAFVMVGLSAERLLRLGNLYRHLELVGLDELGVDQGIELLVPRRGVRVEAEEGIWA